LMLTQILLGELAGMTTLQARTEWVRLQAGWICVVLPVPARRFRAR
jgi:hypothetical protein